MKLRPYQEDAIKALRENKRGIIAAATGSGKTTMMAASIKEKAVHGKILVLVHLQDLVTQTTNRIKSETGLEVAQFYGQVKNDINNAVVVVATWQSLRELTDTSAIPPNFFYSINVDEAHHIRSSEYRAVVKYFESEFLHGFTATPYGPGQDTILEIFGDVLLSIDIFDLIDMGFLTKMQMDVYHTNASKLDNIKSSEYYQSKKEIIQSMEKTLETESRVPKIVHFFKNTKEIEAFSAVAELKNAATYNAYLNQKNRKRILKSFKTNNDSINHLYSMRMLNEGVDIPIINGLIFHERAGDFRTFTQRIGRGIRVYNNDPNAITYIKQFLDITCDEDIKSVTAFEAEIKQSLTRREKDNVDKKYDDYVIINYQHGTKVFLDDYMKRQHEMQENSTIIKRNCPECRSDFYLTKGQIHYLRSDDTVVCSSCGSGVKVMTKCAKCETPVYLLPGIYSKRVRDNSKIHCKTHTTEMNPPVIKQCSHCQKEYKIAFKLYQSNLKRGQKNFFCSKQCRSDFSKVEVSCTICGVSFRVNRGDYNGKLKTNSRFYCTDHIRRSKTKLSAKQ